MTDQDLPNSASFAEAVNQALRPLIGSFKAATVEISDHDGQVSGTYATVIHDGDTNAPPVSIDNVAAIIETVDLLTLEGLRNAYERIARAKSIAKRSRKVGPTGNTDMTTSFILAKQCDVSLEQLSAEVGRLNATTNSTLWPDAVAVLQQGMINYTTQIPGKDRSGDLFLPSQISESWPAAPLFTYKLIRATGDRTFDKIASLVMKRVAIFQPGIQIPDYRALEAGGPSHGITTDTYQFDLKNLLRSVPLSQIIASQLPREKYKISGGGNAHASVQFQDWQDGAVITVIGRFPMDILYAFLGEIVPNFGSLDPQFMRSGELQMSYVLPINRGQFMRALGLLQSRSNMTVRRDDQKIVIQKVADEGTSSPFVARLMFGIMRLRDAAFDKVAEQRQFDTYYEPVLEALRSAREASDEIRSSVSRHQENVRSGSVVAKRGAHIHIDENIDRTLRRELENFLNSGVRTIKTSMQNLIRHFGIDIGFLFAKEAQFIAGIERTKILDQQLADYLVATRRWTEPLVLIRNDLEHGTFPSAKMMYDVDGHPASASEPVFDGKPITTFTSEGLDRICCFVEELSAFCLQRKLPNGLELTEVPLVDRDADAPERFRLTIANAGATPWRLLPHINPFADT